jgi:hypothetical protein|tara:strand:+ start:319 stop:660 length:342 start_codon:yes stop_codon:yes gene_type:complete
MELKDFISNSLVDIQEGVEDAIKRVDEKGTTGVVNPHLVNVKTRASLMQNVQFDIAVTASDKEGQGVKGGIKVVGIAIGADGKTSSETSVVSRIQFNIPIIPPVTEVRNNNPQ